MLDTRSTSPSQPVIWLLNHYAIPPDLPGGSRHFDLAYGLTRRGYDVTIFASAFNHMLRQKTKLLDGEPWELEEIEGVKFVWLPSFPYEGNDWRRAVNMLDYSWRAYWLGRRLTRLTPLVAAPDVVMGCAVHLFAVLAGYYLSRHHQAHFIMEVRDLWPQTFLDMGVWHEGQPQVSFFRRLERFLYKRAEQIVILSPLTRTYLAQYAAAWAAKTVYVPNGTRVERFDQIEPERKTSSRPLKAVFLGSIGFKNGVDLIVRAMHIVEQTEPGLLECVLIGGGPQKPDLEAIVRDLNVSNVRFEDPIPRDQVPGRLVDADMLVLAEREVLYGSSNKLADYMAAGKPIVASVFAEHNDLIKEAGCGASASPGSAEDLAAKLLLVARMEAAERSEMGRRARAYAQRHLDYSMLADRLSNSIDALE